MQNKITRYGPVALTNTYTTNILNPPTAAGGVGAGSSSQYILIRQIRVANKGVSSATFRLWIGATGANAAGTEVVYDKAVAVGEVYDQYFSPALRLDAADFLVGGASAATTLTLTAFGEQGVVG